MARIRHIAISTDDPVKTAEFYKKYFGLTELFRKPAEDGSHGVWLSDGYIYVAILKYGDPDVFNLGPGHKSDLRGLHHIGFLVDDLKGTLAELKEGGVAPLVNFSHDPKRPMLDYSKADNEKYTGPDGVMFDVRDRGWDEAIGGRMQLYELKPAAPKAQKAKPATEKI
jgi:catechol 2,3-dioxygenase-like lactoylglutathione lyase family enzyme